MKMEVKKAEISASLRIGLEEPVREKIVDRLTALLADEHVLYVKTRNYHWNVTGIHFQMLHGFFETQYTELATMIDNLAERIRSLGFFAPGSMADFKDMARLSESGHLHGHGTEMLETLLQDHEAVIRQLRKDIALSEELGDAGTADFQTALMEAHEKMAWMLRAHLG